MSTFEMYVKVCINTLQANKYSARKYIYSFLLYIYWIKKNKSWEIYFCRFILL